MEKDAELVQVWMKLENQETELRHHQQQKEKLQQQYDNSKKTQVRTDKSQQGVIKQYRRDFSTTKS